jgi:hypothetical protein
MLTKARVALGVGVIGTVGTGRTNYVFGTGRIVVVLRKNRTEKKHYE